MFTALKRISPPLRLENHSLICRYLHGYWHTIGSTRLISFEKRLAFRTNKRCYARNDWTTYRAIELENLLANKFGLYQKGR